MTRRPGYRHAVALLVLLSTMMAYLTRVNISTAIVAMVRDSNGTTAAAAAPQFDWDQTSQGVVLGAFFYGYFSFQMVSGRLADSIGPRLLCSIGLLGSGLVNMATPMVAQCSFGLLVASRVLLGLFQAAVFPSCYALASLWIPDHERSTVNSLAYVGSDVGMLVASSAAGYLCRRHGWPWAFYVPGAAAVLFSVLYFVMVRDDPLDHWLVSDQELSYIQANIDRRPKGERATVPWRRLATDRTMWAGAFTHFVMSWTITVTSLKLPDYMHRVVGLPLEQNGFYSSAMFVCEGISLLAGGMMADWLLSKNRFSRTSIRKLFMAVATFGSSVFTVLVPLTGQHQAWFLAAMILSMLTIGMQSGGLVPLPSDMSGEFSATIFAILNGFGMINGFLGPYLIGLILDSKPDAVARQWAIVLYLTAGLRVLGGIVFVLFISAKRRDWAGGCQRKPAKIDDTAVCQGCGVERDHFKDTTDHFAIKTG